MWAVRPCPPATNVVRSILEPLGIHVLDHLVFRDGEMVSIKETAASGRTGGYSMIHLNRWKI